MDAEEKRECTIYEAGVHLRERNHLMGLCYILPAGHTDSRTFINLWHADSDVLSVQLEKQLFSVELRRIICR